MSRQQGTRREARRLQTIRQDFVAYQESVLDELRATQNRIRNLIGHRHWLTDGEHKEATLRTMLRLRLPESMRVSKGFVCYPHLLDSSGQLDILITPRFRPVLYQAGELIFVTANSVEAVAEVKTKLSTGAENSKGSLRGALRRLADQVATIRQNSERRCWASLFIYERAHIDPESLLEALQDAADHDEKRAIDFVSVGDDLIAHYWHNSRRQVNGLLYGPAWHSYEIQRLAPAYFVSNIVVHVSPGIPDEEILAWFPVEGGKETLRRYYVALDSQQVLQF